MIGDFREVENGYLENFSQRDDLGEQVVFWDDRLPDMYAFNCTLVKEGPTGVFELAARRLSEAKRTGKDFLQLILHPSIDVSGRLREDFSSLGFRVETYLYMELAGRDVSGFQGNEDCTVIRVTREEELADGQRLDVETSVAAGMPPEFAVRKAQRKSEVFRDPAKLLFSYLCYHQGQAIGKCELYLNGGYAKLEDFDVVARRQRNGFGTAILKKMITDAVDQGAQHIYLIAATEDTPKDMYRKLGFTVIGEETQLFWGR
jgi:spore maturation protein CgeE